MRHSRALVLGLVALLAVSFAGGATAARLITGADIKDHSITGKDLAKKSVTSATVKDGSLGAADLSAAARSSLTRGEPQGFRGDLVAPGGGGTVNRDLGMVAGHAATLTCSVYGSSYVSGSLSIAGVSHPYRSSTTVATSGGNASAPATSFSSGTGAGALTVADIPQVLAFDVTRTTVTTWIEEPSALVRIDADLVVRGHAEGHACNVVGLSIRMS